MSVIANLSAPVVVRVDTPSKHLLVWTPFLILGAIAACGIAASFYIGAPVVDASIVGP